MPEPGSQNGYRGAVEWRRPEELDRIDEGDQAEEADRFEREAGGTQPDRQRVEDQKKRQARRKSQRQHDQRATLDEDAWRPAGKVTVGRGRWNLFDRGSSFRVWSGSCSGAFYSCSAGRWHCWRWSSTRSCGCLLIPFRLVGIAVDGVLGLLRGIVMLPVRLVSGPRSVRL